MDDIHIAIEDAAGGHLGCGDTLAAYRNAIDAGDKRLARLTYVPESEAVRAFCLLRTLGDETAAGTAAKLFCPLCVEAYFRKAAQKRA